MIKKMGSIRDLMGMIPGMDRAMKGVDVDEKAFGRVEAMITSMTKEERQQPEIINGSRRRRIAAGSGMKVQDVNRLMKQFDDIRRTMRKLTKGKNRGMLNKFNLPGMMPGGLPLPGRKK